MNSQESSSALVTRINAGDQSAASELYDRYAKGLVAMLTRRCGDVDLAKDLAHDTILTLISKFSEQTLEDESQLTSYVFNTAKYIYIGHVRKEERRKTEPASGEHSLESAVEDGDQLSSVVHEESQALVEDLLAKMQPRDRDILRFAYLRELDKRVICEQLNLTSAHYDRVLYRAKDRLRQLIATEVPGEYRGGSV